MLGEFVLPGDAPRADPEASCFPLEKLEIATAPTMRRGAPPHQWNRKVPCAATLAIAAPCVLERLGGGAADRWQEGAAASAVEPRYEIAERLIRFRPPEDAGEVSVAEFRMTAIRGSIGLQP